MGEAMQSFKQFLIEGKTIKRQVTIITRGNSHFVSYLGRKKHGYHNAAQFSARDHSIEHVKAWVDKQPHLELVEK